MKLESMALAVAAAIAGAWPVAAEAHCGPNDVCVDAPCHHGPNTPECLAATGAAKITSKIAEPAIKEEVREIIIPKVPQLNLPVGGETKPPPNAPAALGKIDTRLPPLTDPRPLPPELPASTIARDVAPQIYAGTFAATREIDNARAIEALQKNHPRLANSAYLTERRQIKMGEVFELLKRIDARAQKAVELLGDDSRYQSQRDALDRASLLLQSFGSGEPAAKPQ